VVYVIDVAKHPAGRPIKCIKQSCLINDELSNKNEPEDDCFPFDP